MPRYRFVLDYKSGAGAWRAGDEADFAEDFAAWLNRDVAGCVEAVDDAATAESAWTGDGPPADRMVKTATVRDRRKQRGNEGAMSSTDFKAVKGGG